MKEHRTDLYKVVETAYGLDVYDEDEYVCELLGFSLANFTYDGVINNDELNNYIKDETECNEFIANMNGMY